MADLERRMTPEQLAEIQACADAATGGPWHARGWAVAGAGAGVFVAFDLKTEDAEFVARARVDVPALLAEVRRLREDRDRWRSNRRNAEAVVEEVGDELGEMRKERDHALQLAEEWAKRAQSAAADLAVAKEAAEGAVAAARTLGKQHREERGWLRERIATARQTATEMGAARIIAELDGEVPDDDA